MDILTRVHRLADDIDPDIRVHGRVKGPASIREKMLRNDLALHEVMDIIGVRAITTRTNDCYRLKDLIHGELEVLHDEYDDYIANPKANGYRSIHTTVRCPWGLPVEVQIRTGWMHEICETGPAAHSLYKGRPVYFGADPDNGTLHQVPEHDLQEGEGRE